MNHHMELNLLQHYEYKRMYPVEVKHQYETLRNEETEQGSDLEVVERTWQTLKTSMVQAANKVLPKKDRVQRKSWMTIEILQKMQERQKRKGTKNMKRQTSKSDTCVKNGRKHGGLKSVKKLNNSNGNTKPKRRMPR